MIRTLRSNAALWRRVCLTLAVLALVVKVAVPAGFMVGPREVNSLPFTLVICTGQGMLEIQPGEPVGSHHDKDGEAGKAGHDAPCAFAGHGTAAAPPSLLDPAAVEFVAYAYTPPATFDGYVPGRGLAGPPLPARGPPARLI